MEALSLEKSFVGGDGSELRILRGVDLRVEEGEAVAITGASGAGKSTLLHLLGALDRPTGGQVILGGDPVEGLDDEALAAVRNRHVGFVFQFHHLLREFTALENVMMPALISGAPFPDAEVRARELLAAVGVAERGNLDTKTSDRLHDLLFELRRARALSMVLVTHNRDLAGRADRVLRLRDGRLEANSSG
jgi:lipoprotein-releasing system ATP-binding protein